MISLICAWNSIRNKNLGNILFQTTQTYQILAEIYNRDQALLATLKLKPDLLILDSNLPGTATVDLIVRIIKLETSTKILLIVPEDIPIHSIDLSPMQVDGVVFKGDHPACILETIEYLFKDGLRRNTRIIYPNNYNESNTRMSSSFNLTEQELKVLGLIARGTKNQAIAEELSISKKTVEYHINKILKKLKAKNRAEAACIAYKIRMSTY